MNSTVSTDENTQPTNDSPSFDFTLLKENPQVQQLLLMALSTANQENETTVTDNDKRKYDQLDTLSSSSEQATLSDHGSPGSDSNSDKLRPGRKPLTEEEIKMADMDPKSKRKAQNRAAQRAFRERRVNYVKELEDKIKQLEQNQNEKVMEENRQLKKIIQQLQVENTILGQQSSFDVPLSQLGSDRPQKLLRSMDDPLLPSSSHHSPTLTPPPDSTHFLSTAPTDVLTSFGSFSFDNDDFNTLPTDALIADDEPLTKTWDKITEHPHFDEFDIDVLCDEMKRKAACSTKSYDDQVKETIEKHYPHLL